MYKPRNQGSWEGVCESPSVEGNRKVWARGPLPEGSVQANVGTWLYVARMVGGCRVCYIVKATAEPRHMPRHKEGMGTGEPQVASTRQPQEGWQLQAIL